MLAQIQDSAIRQSTESRHCLLKSRLTHKSPKFILAKEPRRFRDFHDRSLSRGQKLSRRAREERVCKFLLVLRRVCWLLSRGSSQGEPDFHLLFQTSEWS